MANRRSPFGWVVQYLAEEGDARLGEPGALQKRLGESGIVGVTGQFSREWSLLSASEAISAEEIFAEVSRARRTLETVAQGKW